MGNWRPPTAALLAWLRRRRWVIAAFLIFMAWLVLRACPPQQRWYMLVVCVIWSGGLFAFGEDLRRRWVKITSGPLLLVWVFLLIFEAPVDREANLFLLSLTGLTNLYATGVIGSKGGS